MMDIYIYKMLYNNYGIDVFINEEMINKFKLKEYQDLILINLLK